MKWVRANTSLHAIADPVSALDDFLGHYRELSPKAAALFPSTTAAALERLRAEDPDRDFRFVLHVVLGYLLSLDHTELWNGSDAQYEQVEEALFELVDELSDAEFDDRIFVVPAQTFDQTRDALLALPLAGRLQAFMEWFGDKRDVTSKGKLTRKDIEGAAATLGVAAVGVNTNPSLSLETDGGPLRVATARDVPSLDMYWDALVSIGIIEPGAKRATMNHPLANLTGRKHEEMLMHIIIDVALSLYGQFNFVEDVDDLGQDLADKDIADKDIADEDTAGMLMTSMLLDAGIEDGYPAADLEQALAVTAGEDQIDLMLAQLALELLGAEGLVEIGTHYRIPDVLKKLVTFAIAEPAGLEVVYADPKDESLGYLGAAD